MNQQVISIGLLHCAATRPSALARLQHPRRLLPLLGPLIRDEHPRVRGAPKLPRVSIPSLSAPSVP